MADMQAVRLHSFGGPETLRLETVTRPVPGEGEMLVRVVSTSVNPIDYKTRKGELRFMFGEDKLPLILGRDVAGRIEAVGAGVTGWAAGDPVYARPGLERGSYAEYVVVKEGEIAAPPRSLPLADTGAIPLAALVAWQALVEVGGLQSGQRVLIHGGAGGVGHLAIQFARKLGAVVFATCSERDLDYVRGLGAERAIDYRSERFEGIATNIDVVLDNVGGETQSRSWSVLKPGGILISPVQKPDAESARRAQARPSEQFMAKASSADLTTIADLIDSGDVSVTISGRYTLDKVAAAQAEQEKGGVRGKLLVLVDQG